MRIDFSTFCHKGDAPRLHRPNQLRRQVLSNEYLFNQVIVIHQQCDPNDYEPILWNMSYPLFLYRIDDLDLILNDFRVDINKPQYVSSVDKAHFWKYHVVNHLAAVQRSQSDYMVFADADCWIIRQNSSWVNKAIKILESQPDVFLVSPNDGEPERKTQVMSQQMFMVRTEEFRNMDFNQPGWDGDVKKLSEMPEYASMLEGRIHFYCKYHNKYRYVLGPEYRYWHFNRINPETNHFEMDLNKY